MQATIRVKIFNHGPNKRIVTRMPKELAGSRWELLAQGDRLLYVKTNSEVGNKAALNNKAPYAYVGFSNKALSRLRPEYTDYGDYTYKQTVNIQDGGFEVVLPSRKEPKKETPKIASVATIQKTPSALNYSKDDIVRAIKSVENFADEYGYEIVSSNGKIKLTKNEVIGA